MKTFYSLILLTAIPVLVSVAGNAQTTRRWVGANNSSWATAGNWRTGTTGGSTGVPASGDIILFNDGNTITITNVPTITLRSLTVTNNSKYTLTGATGTQTLTVGNGGSGDDLVINSGSILTLGSGLENIAIGNNSTASVSGTFTISNTAGTFNTNGTGVVTTVSGTINNYGTVTSSTGTKLVFAAGSTYNHARNGGVIPTATWKDNSTCAITGWTNTTATPENYGLGQSFYNFTWNSPGQTADLSFAGYMSSDYSSAVRGAFTVTSTGSGSLRLLNGNAERRLNVGQFSQTGGRFYVLGSGGDNGYDAIMTLDVAGDFSLTGGTLYISGATTGTNSNAGTLRVAGDFTHTGGTITESASRGTANIIFDGTTPQTYTSGGTVSNEVNFTVNNGATLQMAAATTVITGNGEFTLSSGATLGIKSPDGINSTGNLGHIRTSDRTFSAGASLIYNGSVAQNTGNFNTSGTANTIAKLTINNAAGVTLTKATLFIDNNLNLQNGELITRLSPSTANTLTINNSGSATVNPSGTSYVVGPVRVVRNTASSRATGFVFPTGKAGVGYIPIAISSITASGGTFEAELVPQTAISHGNLTATGVTAADNCQYWNLKGITGTVTATVTMNWNSFSACGPDYVTNPVDKTVIIRNPNSSAWDTKSAAAASGSVASGTISWSGVSVTGATSFALATTAPQATPLPVKFGDIKASVKDKGVQIDWDVYSEFNVVRYEIERSGDGVSFSYAGSVAAKNQDGKLYYGWFDATPLAGTNYYRIRNVDIDGKFEYSSVVKVSLNKLSAGVAIYPNPVSGNHISIQVADVQKGNFNIEIFNAAGQQVYSKQFNHAGGTISRSIELPASLQRGIYHIQLAGEGYKQVKSFLVQ